MVASQPWRTAARNFQVSACKPTRTPPRFSSNQTFEFPAKTCLNSARSFETPREFVIGLSAQHRRPRLTKITFTHLRSVPKSWTAASERRSHPVGHRTRTGLEFATGGSLFPRRSFRASSSTVNRGNCTRCSQLRSLLNSACYVRPIEMAVV